MLHVMDGFPGFRAMNIAKPQSYYRTLRESSFVLAPRGYGKTSFRMYEAMAMGAVPIYIYNEPWVPYMEELDWNKLALFCHVKDIADLPALIDAVDDEELRRRREYIKEVYNDYFTVEGIVRYVKEYLDDASRTASGVRVGL